MRGRVYLIIFDTAEEESKLKGLVESLERPVTFN